MKLTASNLILLTLVLVNPACRADEHDFLECAAANDLWLTKAGDSTFDEDSKSWNIQHDWKPAAVVFVTSLEDTSKAVACANKAGLKVSPRSGGHSYEGYGSGGQDGSVILDVGSLTGIAVHPKSMLADCGAGVRLGQLYYQLWTFHRMWFPPGLCPTLGIAGFTLGGGVGFWSRKWGLASDHVMEMTVVLANGTAVTADAQNNSDLYWALRGGGGGNFGVVTNFRLRVEKAPATVYVVIRTWPLELTSKLICHMLRITEDGDDEVGWEFILYSDRVQLWATLIDPTAYSLDRMLTLFGNLPEPQVEISEEMSFLDAYLNVSDRLGVVGSTEELNFPPSAKFKHKYAKKKSLVLNLREHFDQERCDMLQYRMSFADPDTVIHFELLGGKINGIGPSESAFVHRNSSVTIGLAIIKDTPIPEKSLVWLEDTWKALRSPNSTLPIRAYQNYMDMKLENWADAYYGDNLRRLKTVQQKYDPTGVFDNPQTLTRVNGESPQSKQLPHLQTEAYFR